MTVYAQGVDYAWQRPSVNALVAAGKTFACRYGGPGSSGKQLDAAEVKALTSAGIAIIANAEGAADAFVDAAAGVSWARQARDHFQALGMPADRPIYFSADFNAAAGDLARIDTALRAAASVVGAANVGVYGEYDVMRHCAAAGTAAWRWQTLAWSGGRWATDINHIEQYRNAVSLPGDPAVLDLDRAVKSDFGQWGVGDDMALDSTDLGKIEDIVKKYVGDVVHRYVVQDGKIVLVPETDPNPRMMASSALQYIQLTALQNQLALKELAAQVGQVDEAVWSKISDPATPDEQVAAALSQLLGDRAPAVIALMQPHIA